MRFLIVDDSKAVQAIIRRCLAGAGFPDLELLVANDGEEALHIIEELEPDLVLSDWHMPRLDGIQLLQTLRKHHPKQRLGFITSEYDQEKIDLALETGALFVVQKPFDGPTLIDTISKALAVKFIGSDDTLAVRTEKLMVMAMPKEGVTGILDSTYGIGKFKVESLPQVDSDIIDLPSAVGVFAHKDSKEIHALALMDHAAMLLLGGSFTGKSFSALESLLMSNEIPADIWVGVQQFIETGVARMFVASDRGTLLALKSQIIKHRPENLVTIMKRSATRSDFAVTRATLPSGRLTLIAK